MNKKHMTQEEANKLVKAILFAIQKGRSDISEGLAGHGREPDRVELSVLQVTSPALFPPEDVSVTPLDLAQALFNKGDVHPIDLFNLIGIIDRLDDLGQLRMITSMFYGMQIPEISPIPQWIAGWNSQNSNE